jgi:hypothetical protein
MVAIVATQRAGAALGVVVLRARHAVVGEQRDTALHARGDRAQPRAHARAEFRDVSVRQRQLREQAAHLACDARIGRPLAPLQVGAHAHTAHLTAAQREALHRQRVEHLVRDQHTLPRLGRWRLEELDTRAQRVGQRVQPRLLARAQLRPELENAIAPRQRVELLQGRQQLRRQRAASGADLEHITACEPQQRRHLLGQALTKQRGYFGRRSEIAARAEHLRTARVVPPAGRVQHEVHGALEIEPAAGGLDRRAQLRTRMRLARRLLHARLSVHTPSP